MTINLREFDSFFHVTTWGEWCDVTKRTFPGYFNQWLVSNTLGLMLLMIAYHVPKFSRRAWGFLLILASIVNTYMMLTDPVCYQEFGVLAIPPVQRFIYSKFFAQPAWVVLPIAICQGLVGTELLFGDSPYLLKIALTCAIVFFVGITTLGVGSGFPSSVLYAMTMMRCWPSDAKSKSL